MVMPRSRSSEFESRCWALMSRLATVLVSTRMRSASVDLPWSMWATMQKLRILSRFIRESSKSYTGERRGPLGRRRGGLADLPRFELARPPEGGAEPAGIVAGQLRDLDSDFGLEDVVDLLLHADADLLEQELAREGHPAGEDDDVGIEHLDDARHPAGKP